MFPEELLPFVTSRLCILCW